MRILFICAKYNVNPNNPYLTNDLVNEFRRKGNFVQVFCLGDVDSSSDARNPSDILLPYSNKVQILKFILLWPIGIYQFFKKVNKDGSDLIFATSPLSTITPIVLLALTLKVKKRICFIADIFPNHQIEIKHINRNVARIFKVFEKYIIRKFDIVLGMSNANIEVIKSYYQIDLSKTQLDVLKLWGVNLKIATKAYEQVHITKNKINMVFGGQLVRGRNIVFLLDFIKALQERELKIHLTIFSEGDYFEELKQQYSKNSDIVSFKNKLSRSEYLSQISSFDVGAIVTDPRVTTPTFPSKILDYINSGLRCFCVIEDASDIDVEIDYPDFLFTNRFDMGSDSIEKAVAFFNKILLQNPEKIDPIKFAQFTPEVAVMKIDSLINNRI
jgi:glycosyltransferase involved in cell wall biosynthesis